MYNLLIHIWFLLKKTVKDNTVDVNPQTGFRSLFLNIEPSVPYSLLLIPISVLQSW